MVLIVLAKTCTAMLVDTWMKYSLEVADGILLYVVNERHSFKEDLKSKKSHSPQ